MIPVLTFFLYLFLFWGVVWIFFSLIKSQLKEETIQNLHDSYGLTISFGQVGWFTYRFNHGFQIFSKKYRRYLNFWFSFGSLIGILGMFGSIIFLFINLTKLLFPSRINENQIEQPLLTPVIPGINIPTDQLIYYFIALFVSGVLHEVGHAIAGTCENVKLQGFGMFILFLYPGAYVEFKEDFDSLSAFRKLKIFCAGAWHNFVIAGVCYLLLWSLPIISFAFYKSTNGFLVMDVEKGSTLDGYILPNDKIVQLTDCEVNSRDTWRDCLVSISNLQKGFCKSSEFIREAVTNNNLDCCGEFLDKHSLYCFEVYETTKAKYNICASAREVLKDSKSCIDDISKCSDNEICLNPIQSKGLFLINIFLENGTNIAFSGHPGYLWFTISGTDKEPRMFSPFGPSLLLHFEKTLQYTFSISAALGVLNLAPVYYLDGQYVCDTFLELFLSTSQENREYLSKIIKSGTAIMLGLTVFLSLKSIL